MRISHAKVGHPETRPRPKDEIIPLDTMKVMYQEAATYPCIAFLELEYPHSFPFPSKHSRNNRTVASLAGSDSHEVLVRDRPAAWVRCVSRWYHSRQEEYSGECRFSLELPLLARNGRQRTKNSCSIIRGDKMIISYGYLRQGSFQ